MITLLIGLAVVGFVIFCFILYWVAIIALFCIGVLFLSWACLFTYFFNEPYLALPCAVFATVLTLWVFAAYSEHGDRKKASGNF